MTPPKCRYRLKTTKPGTYYCRSPQVQARDNFVSVGVCLICSAHAIECDSRPSPIQLPVPYVPRRVDTRFAAPPPPEAGSWRWAYGVTVASRPVPTIRRTLDSLGQAGFESPYLFVDGTADVPNGLPMTRRHSQIGAWPNWILAAHELYQRDPHASAYALFQDDILLAQNVRRFLEVCSWPERGYLNLYTAEQNGRGKTWFVPPAKGRGALGLVFDNSTMRTLLQSGDVLEHRTSVLGFKRIDVAVSTALERAGIHEYVHDPSLIEHQISPIVDVPEHNSTLGHNYGARSSSFPGEEFDALTLALPRTPVVKKSQPRLGLIGFNTASGIGSCNRDLCQHLPVDRWLAIEHDRFPTLDSPRELEVRVCSGSEANTELELLCRDVDVLLTVETEYIRGQTETARRFGITTVCIPMLEWLPPDGWPRLIDLYLCPTRQAFTAIEAEWPGRCHEFPWPIDTQRFEFRERGVCERYLFVNGHGGHSQRKGGDIVRCAAEMASSVPIIVYDQTGGTWPDNCEVRGESLSREALYTDGQVLLFPSRFNGIGLEQLEAMAAGMPVIATDAAPMNERPCLDLIRCASSHRTKGRRARAIRVNEPDPSHLAELLRKWLGQNIAHWSRAARQFAESRSWASAAERILNAVRS